MIRYAASHGGAQTEYCQSKLDIAKDLTGMTTVYEAENRGWGATLARFQTYALPCLEFLRYMCYRPDPDRPGMYLKTVTQEWVDQLNWRQVAWWYQDDGGRQGTSMVFSTHSFTQTECARLAAWLTANGVAARAKQTHKRQNTYWVVKVLSDAAEVLTEKIRPHMHPTMLYKLPTRKTITCVVCGKASRRQNSAVTCLSAVCRRAHRLESKREEHRRMTPEQRSAKYARFQESLKAAPEKVEKLKTYQAVRMQEIRKDPERAKAYNDNKKRWRAQRKALGIVERQNQTYTCGCCGKMFQNTATHKMSPRSPFIHCQKPACKLWATNQNADLRRARAREKWAQDRSLSSTPS